jgi:heme exporter protein C
MPCLKFFKTTGSAFYVFAWLVASALRRRYWSIGAMPGTDKIFLEDRSASNKPWFRYASPQAFFPIAGKLIPWFMSAALVLAACGLYIGFFVAPTDQQQGEAYRIIFVHVPAAWMSMLIYLVMAAWAGIGMVFNTRLSSMMAQALAPTGALFTVMALWTGALWGKPMWGAWWVWDARLTSELILLFLYIGFIALQSSIDEPRRADRAGAVLALVGVINIPVIYFSVKWWNTLHQGASVSLVKAPSMATNMLAGMLIMVLAFWAYSIAVSLMRLRCIVLERERHTAWARHYAEQQE